MNSDRFDRNELFFGKAGQQRLRATHCTIVGIGGLGSHLVQQLALLGIGRLSLIEPEELALDNRNRYVGAWHSDPIPGTPKTEIGQRLVQLIDPTIKVDVIPKSCVSADGYSAIKGADYVFGCLDNEGARLVVTEICSAYAKPYIDLATDIHPEDRALRYGGRVHVGKNGESCLVCMSVLDVSEAGRDLESDELRKNRNAVYGIGRESLGRPGPSVVSLNGVVASLAVTEFMVAVTGIRAPQRLLTYYGHTGKVTTSTTPPRKDCYFCKGIWGKGSNANAERYIKSDSRT